MPGSIQTIFLTRQNGMTVFCFDGRAFASLKISLSCFSIVCATDACVLFSECRRINILVITWFVWWLEVVLVIALHCPNIRSSISVFRRRSDMIRFNKGAWVVSAWK